MSRRARIILLAVLLVLSAAGYGGWWIAADRGWIPGKPNSPRAENFKAALDDYYARTTNLSSRNCISLGYYGGQRQAGFPDTGFDWTPAGFLARTDSESARNPSMAKRLALLERHGHLQLRRNEGGVQEYGLTWKGYAASGGNGCFFVTSGEREAKVLAGEKARVENGVEIYEVVARPLPKSIEPWAADAGFREAFENSYQRNMLEPEPVTYELARGASGFAVVGEKSRQGQSPSRQPTPGPEAAVLAKLRGEVTPERVMQAIEAYLQRVQARNQACVDVPQQGEADESTVYGSGYAQPGLPRAPVTVTFYNLIERRDHAQTAVLRGYETMRRLEALGLAKSELMGVADWQGRPAAGAVRYELTEAGMARLGRGGSRCLAVGTLVPEAVVSVQQFSEVQPRPRFFGRARLKADDDAKEIVSRFGHFTRMADPGAAIQGSLRYQDGQLQVESLQVVQPRFAPDVAELKLPIVEPPKPAPAALGKGAPPARIGAAGRDVVFQQAMNMSTLSNGGLTMTYCCAGASTAAYSDLAQSAGKWYAELSLRTRAGSANPDTWTNVLVMPQPRDGSSRELMMAAAQPGALGRDKARYRSGDVIGIAVDADSGRAWYSLNGEWMNGTPGSGGGAPLPRGVPLVVVATSSASSQSGGGNDAWTANFGKTRFRSAIPRGFRSWDNRQGN
jgi:hypothetical protein